MNKGISATKGMELQEKMVCNYMNKGHGTTEKRNFSINGHLTSGTKGMELQEQRIWNYKNKGSGKVVVKGVLKIIEIRRIGGGLENYKLDLVGVCRVGTISDFNTI